MFLDYLLQNPEKQPEDLHPVLRFLLLSICSIVLAFLNYRGLDVVGRFSIAICVIAMSPFIIFTIIGIPQINPSKWLTKPSLTVEEYESVSDYDLGGGLFPNAVLGGVLLRPYLNNLFWNLNSFDSAAAFSEDLGNNHGKLLSRGLTIAWFMTVFGYIIPLLVATGVSDGSQEDWSEGFMAAVATDAVGPWLGAWTIFAAGISNLALFQAELSADSFQLMGMAHSGFLPAILGMRSKHGTPTWAIAVGTIVIVLFSIARLDKLIEMLNFNYSLSLLMEYAAFIKLRISRPNGMKYKVCL